RASAFHGWRRAPDSQVRQWLSGWRGGSSAWSARPDRRSCNWPDRSFCGLPVLVLRFFIFRTHTADEIEFSLEIHVMRQFQMLDKPGRLHIVGMGNDEFLVLGRCRHIRIEFPHAQCTVAERHGHGLAFALAENQTVTARELRRLLG